MKYLIFIIILSGLVVSTKLWECNRCHQQYTGNNPPRLVKCPATENKQTHWWIQKNR